MEVVTRPYGLLFCNHSHIHRLRADEVLEHYKASSDLGMALPCLLGAGPNGVTRAPQQLTLSPWLGTLPGSAKSDVPFESRDAGPGPVPSLSGKQFLSMPGRSQGCWDGWVEPWPVLLC